MHAPVGVPGGVDRLLQDVVAALVPLDDVHCRYRPFGERIGIGDDVHVGIDGAVALDDGRTTRPEGARDALGGGGDEARVLEPRCREHDRRRVGRALARGADVADGALPRGLRAERREDDGQRSTVAARRHRGQGLVQERMPVAHAHEHRERTAAGAERTAEPLGLGLRQLVEGRAAARHPLVVVGDLLQTLGRNAAPARDDLEERPDLRGSRGPAEGDQQDAVDGAHRALSSWTISTSACTCSTGVC